MSTIKTLVNDDNVTDFINTVTDETKKKDSFQLLAMLAELTDEQPKMWGSSIIGFGQYHYKSEKSKQEGDWPLIGFSPRKDNLTIYIMDGFVDYETLLKKIGKYKNSKGCLYIKKLMDIDQTILEKLLKESYEKMKRKNPRSS